MSSKLIAGAYRQVVCSKQADTGEMFKAEVGVWKDKSGYTAYVTGGWGGGAKSKAYPTKQEAQAAVPRLWTMFFGDVDTDPPSW